MLFCIHNTLRLLRSRKTAPYPTFVFRKSPLNISRDAGIERTVLAFKQIYEVRHDLENNLYEGSPDGRQRTIQVEI